LRSEVQDKRNNIAYLDTCLDQFKNFNNSETNLGTALEQSLHFFKAQGTGQAPTPPADF